MTLDIRYQAAIIRGHRIFMLKVWDHAGSGRIFWVIPGGGRLPDESEEQCVVREALEESHLALNDPITSRKLALVRSALGYTRADGDSQS